MRLRFAGTIVVIGAIVLLLLPEIALTQGGRVLNRRLRRSYPTISAAIADPARRDRDVFVVSGAVTETDSIDLAGFNGTIQGSLGARVTSTACSLDGVFDASGRNGPVTLMGMAIVVPDSCDGVNSDLSGFGFPLTLRNLRITGAAGAGNIDGLDIEDDGPGPFVIEGNVISADLCYGIAVHPDDTAAATVRSNRITDMGSSCDENLIEIRHFDPGSSALVERNTVDGGGPTFGDDIGISIEEVDIVVAVVRNTVRNLSAGGGIGIGVDDCPGTQVRANLVKDNETGISVDFNGSDSGATPYINDNNIICSNLASCKASGFIGLFFDSTTATYNLDAARNYWGASSGPDSAEDGNPGGNCPEATGAACLGIGGGGTGLGVNNNSGAAPDCGLGAGNVLTCPIRTVPNLLAGA